MTIANLAPAIGGVVLGGGLWLYALWLRHKLHAKRARPEIVR